MEGKYCIIVTRLLIEDSINILIDSNTIILVFKFTLY